MKQAKKLQVTLSPFDYEAVERAAEARGVKLAAVAREAIQQYCVQPEVQTRQIAAIARLESASPIPMPPPECLDQWKREYSLLKTGDITELDRKERDDRQP